MLFPRMTCAFRHRNGFPSDLGNAMETGIGFSYEIHYTKAADKFFKTHEFVREQYEAAMRDQMTGASPAAWDVKRIKGKRNDYYRLRLGGWRVVYAVVNGTIIVITALLAGPRGDVYKKMSGLK